jgi:hypothetical protein
MGNTPETGTPARTRNRKRQRLSATAIGDR